MKKHAPAFLAALALAVIPAARADPQTPATTAAPIKNFRLPTFTAEGFRQTMIRAASARFPDPARIDTRIDATELELTLFTGDAAEGIDAMLAAPLASIWPDKQFASGPDTVRLERLDLTVTGADWSYDHPAQKILINRDAHVILRVPLGDIL